MSHDRNIYNSKVELVKDIVAEHEEQRQFNALEKIYKDHKVHEKRADKYLKEQEKKLKFKLEKLEPKYEKLEAFRKMQRDDFLEGPKELRLKSKKIEKKVEAQKQLVLAAK